MPSSFDAKVVKRMVGPGVSGYASPVSLRAE
jgi:hypothetical protein